MESNSRSVDGESVESGDNFAHIPVLSQEIISGLEIQQDGNYLDATVGGAGHSRLILSAVPNIQLTAMDRDKDALREAQKQLSDHREQVTFIHSNFAEYDFPECKFDGIVADLGVSSYHLDAAHRGFSFRQDGDLDMRMDRTQELTAAEIINYWDEVQLANIFFNYGEERLSRRIARRIVEKRPFSTTLELAQTVSEAVPKKYRYGRIHPATRVFQGLRIAVNDELGALETLIEKAPSSLKVGGKIAIISFHSLEDRLVKHGLRNSPLVKVLTKKPITATPEEITQNVRSRSAKLRIAQRIE